MPVLHVLGFQAVLVVPVGAEIDAEEVADGADLAQHRGGRGAEAAAHGNVGAQLDIHAPVGLEVEAVKQGDEGKLEELNRLEQYFANTEVSLKKVVIVGGDTFAKLAQGPQREAFTLGIVLQRE